MFFLLLLALQIFAVPARPDPQLTPGAVRTSDAHEICAKDFRTGPYRKTTAVMKKHVCLEYHVTDCPHQGKEELDHLIPLELGGEDAEANLWVQFAPAYHWKDALENKLKMLVCVGNLPLDQAQHEIATDWVAAYQKYIGPLPHSPEGSNQRDNRDAGREFMGMHSASPSPAKLH